jgi:hypothetical protein
LAKPFPIVSYRYVGQRAANSREPSSIIIIMTERRRNKDTDSNKIARMSIFSALLKTSSVQELTVAPDCLSEAMEVIEACTTVQQIHCNGGTAEEQQKLQVIAERNRALARVSASPHSSPTDAGSTPPSGDFV